MTLPERCGQDFVNVEFIIGNSWNRISDWSFPGEPERTPAPLARPVSGIFAMELEQTVQREAGLRGHVDASIHIDLVQVNFDEILNEPVPIPRYKSVSVFLLLFSRFLL